VTDTAGAADAAMDDTDTQSAIDAATEALHAARARLAEAPPEMVVANHVMGLYELGAIHLSSDPPNLPGASLAIDAVACLVEGLGDRLGDDVETLRVALTNIRLAFVQVKRSSTGADAAAEPDAAGG
jgi:hypothetical protein